MPGQLSRQIRGHLGQREDEDQDEEQLQWGDDSFLSPLPDLRPTYLHGPILPTFLRIGSKPSASFDQGSIGAHVGPVTPSFSSSFGNSGVGLLSGVPGWIGRDSQRACSPA